MEQAVGGRVHGWANFYTVGSNGWVMHETMGLGFCFSRWRGKWSMVVAEESGMVVDVIERSFLFFLTNNKQSWVFYYGGIDNQLFVF